jgi:hypothetical protein
MRCEKSQRTHLENALVLCNCYIYTGEKSEPLIDLFLTEPLKITQHTEQNTLYSCMKNETGICRIGKSQVSENVHLAGLRREEKNMQDEEISDV